MLGMIDGEVDVGRRGLVTHLLLAPLTEECLGRRAGERQTGFRADAVSPIYPGQLVNPAQIIERNVYRCRYSLRQLFANAAIAASRVAS
jgi:hypothetical protein